MMQEFQQAHRRMFAETERNHHNVQHDMQSRSRSLKSKPLVTVQTYEERLGHEIHNGDIYAVVQNGNGTRGAAKPRPAPLSVVEAEAVSAALAKPAEPSRQKRGVEMTSIDTLTLSSPTSPKPKPPATYFAGGKSNKSQSVVTITEYPSNERRSAPNKMEFISNGTSMHDNTDDPLSALQSELQNTLSRSNLRQLSEPGIAPPPPSPPSSPKHHGHTRPLSPPTMSIDEPMTNGVHVEMRKIQPKPIQHRRPPSLINLEPPVRALKPVAEPYTELVTQKNLQLFNYNPDVTVTSPPPPPVSPVVTAAPVAVVVPKASEPIKKPKVSATHHPGHQLEVMDSLANKVTIKFANGESQSAGAKGLTALMASAPPVTAGILKNGNHKHKTVIHQKSITFGEMKFFNSIQTNNGDVCPSPRFLKPDDARKGMTLFFLLY
ncbi:hypothetical protein B566_EDAN002812 [Ephemera danica]|nr:hypothetical protein B566_EDAN002812 [Ephemera danica]